VLGIWIKAIISKQTTVNNATVEEVKDNNKNGDQDQEDEQKKEDDSLTKLLEEYVNLSVVGNFYDNCYGWF